MKRRPEHGADVCCNYAPPSTSIYSLGETPSIAIYRAEVIALARLRAVITAENTVARRTASASQRRLLALPTIVRGPGCGLCRTARAHHPAAEGCAGGITLLGPLVLLLDQLRLV